MKKILCSVVALLVIANLVGCSEKTEKVEVVADNQPSGKTLDQLTMEEKITRALPFHQEDSAAVELITIVGNVHYVGAKKIGSYLIVRDEGHFLLDSGTREMEPVIIDNIRKLGYDIKDVEILLATHAHFDHIQGHEALRQASGAKVMAVGDDAKALKQGKDISPLGFEGWEPVEVAKVLEDGDQLTLGNTTMIAHHIPGHTQGCTVWETTVLETNVQDNAEPITVAFFGCTGPNDGVQIVGNQNFPNLVDDTLMGYQRLRAMNPDIYVTNHPAADIAQYGDAMRRGDRPHPLLAKQPWQDFVDQLEANFRARIE